MKIQPTYAQVEKIAATGCYNVLPVSLEILSDFTTPIETMKILKNVSTHCYMLESAQANETWGRYTFLGFDPKMEITCIDGEMKIGSLKVKTDNPSNYLRQILADYKMCIRDSYYTLEESSSGISSRIFLYQSFSSPFSRNAN